MSDRNLYLAASQYANRPADERFESLPALLSACTFDDATSSTAKAPLGVLHARASDDNTEVILNGRTNAARLSHWAFGQLASVAGAPASYLRGLPAGLAADCINDGLAKRQAPINLELAARKAAGRSDAGIDQAIQQLYVRRPAGDAGPGALPTIRALTSDSYTRVLDSSIVAPLVKMTEAAPDWNLPLTWAGPRAGAYRGDRDLFVILTNGGSIVDDPTLRNSPTGPDGNGGGAMYRGLIVKNSEVGACSLQLHMVLFRYICGNHILWGVESHQQFRRRHVGTKTAREFFSLLSATVRDLANRPASVDAAYLDRLIKAEPWKTDDDVKAALTELGLTEAQAAASWTAAEQHESNPRSVWGIVNGITRASQTVDYAGERLTLDLLAGKLTRRYAMAAAR